MDRSALEEQGASASHMTKCCMGGDCWTLWWSKKVWEQFPAVLSHNQVMEAKREELHNLAERGLYKVVDCCEVKMNPGSVVLSVKWLNTNK